MSKDNQPKVKKFYWLDSRWVGLLSLIGTIAGLVGISVFGLWDKWQESEKTHQLPSGATTAASTSINHEGASNKPLSRTVMPIITGNYTLCSTAESSPASTRWLNFLYDVNSNAGKTVFFDVTVDVECLVGKSDFERSLGREAEDGQVNYAFRHLPLFTKTDQQYIAGLLDAPRDINRLKDMIPDNGTYILIRQDRDGRNAYSRLQIHAEGMEDQIYGPFLIKESGEDAFIQFELSPPILDSFSEETVARIAEQRRAHKLNQLSAPK